MKRIKPTRKHLRRRITVDSVGTTCVFGELSKADLQILVCALGLASPLPSRRGKVGFAHFRFDSSLDKSGNLLYPDDHIMATLSAVDREKRKIFRTTFGANIRRIREERRMTQLVLAKALGYPHPSAGSIISRWESGCRVPKMGMLYRLARTLGVPVGRLIGES